MPRASKKTSRSSIGRDKIIIRRARVNNLKNISVDIPKEKLVVITGLSGSGKSSLAFDVIYAEGNRRYLEGMSSYARQFLDISAKPDVDKIENLSPTISIDQKSISRSPRSTVGTMTEIYDYLRILYSKIGVPHCPKCNFPMGKKTNQEILDEILKLPDKTQVGIYFKINSQGEVKDDLKSASQLGYARTRIEGKIMTITEAMERTNEFNQPVDVEIIVDRINFNRKHPDKERILDSIETAFRLGQGMMTISLDNGESRAYNRDFICPKCHLKISEITPKHFSFNGPEGACRCCSGLGFVREVDENLIIPNKKLTLAEGAILPLSKSGGRNNGAGGYLAALREIGRKYNFSIDDPVKDISAENMEIILYGIPAKERSILDKNGDSQSFPGVIALIKKKYDDNSSLIGKNEIEKYMLEKTCPCCIGRRLKDEYLSVLIQDKSINDVSEMDMKSLIEHLEGLKKNDQYGPEKEIVDLLLKEMLFKINSIMNVGLSYLSLSRGANTLSGGEGQRIRLATQIGSDLSGIVYVLDEPSIGLHDRDTQKLIQTMENLREAGNSIIVVEHDKEVMKCADWIIDMGPGAGEEGGEVIFEGTVEKLKTAGTATAKFLSGKEKVIIKKKRRKGNGKYIQIIGAKEHNLKDINVSFPLGTLTAVTGVSGSGKSSLVSDILSRALSRHFFGAKDAPGKHKKINGLTHIDKVISINQSPIGRTPRSNAATYTGVFSLIRDLFCQTEEALNRSYDASRFSFNIRGGRCEDCQGDGTKKIEMHLLPDMYVRCETCQGMRYNQKTLEIEYQGVNISQVLDMSISYALRFFHRSPLIVEKLRTLEEVGLGYLKLGQSATNLSGGEAQRVKLATELARKSTGKTLYILDEPTIGLHFGDVKRLLQVLDALVNKGNTVLVVEHNSDVINNSDWVIDLGPDGGDSGGQIIYAGIPEGLKKCKESWTGKYL